MRILMFVFFLLFGVYLSAQDKSNCNCCSEDHKAFNFWIGEWEVVNFKDGSPAGYSKIQLEEDGCVIRENWTSAKAGYTGTSLNFYNSGTQEWEQLWVDNNGAVLNLKGNKKGNQMILTSGTISNTDGTTYKNRITWTNNKDGTVRQLWEIIDGKNNITVAFDGIYKKLEKTKNR
ncbi:MAG: hypothetical protein VX772_10495 [Bacteroidota bacterium]|uniref:Lipocalin-like domain-containing protein n=1 Tax=Flagellimonas okinawensis TaxID=3031324 RepID=A0ABT5XKT3_9FLAO|nr:hypothetical protein [[Muricauda] okinawensis]MDF0706498.1 hypothetical protein [[Muricauda] okinawensis]MEC8832778.1 hypothetical protein [Bacteroidota bacterium]